jgi:hypothetical protein
MRLNLLIAVPAVVEYLANTVPFGRGFADVPRTPDRPY